MATDALEICNTALSEIGAKQITSLTADSCKEDRLCNQFYAKLRDNLLSQFSWNFARKATPLNRTDLYETETGYDDYVTITAASQTNPVVITATNSYSAGQIVFIDDVGGMEEINDRYFEVTANLATSFSLLGVDGAKYTAYTSGGTAILASPITDYRDGYTYTIPTDCLKPIKLDSGIEFELVAGNLLTVDDAPILIYIKQETDTTKFPITFEQCLKYELAMTLCRPLLGAKEGSVIREKIAPDYYRAFAEATRVNANEIKKTTTNSDSWLTARN